MPALIADLGHQANWRYVEFFTANINNDHTRRAYARVQPVFRLVRKSRALAHCHSPVRRRGLGQRTAADTRGAGREAAAGGCAHAVRLAYHRADRTDEPGGGGARPKHVVKTGKTPVLDGEEWRRLFASIPTTTLRDLRDRALIATLTYSFARIGAALKMRVEDVRPRGAGWTVRLHEKGGKEHAMPCHHALAEALRAFVDAAGIAEDRKGWLFRTARGHKADTLSELAMNQSDAWCMIRRRAAAAVITAPIGCHTFRATGITAYLANGGALEHAQEMAAHESPRTTKLYDRTKERLTQGEVERIRL